MRLQFDEQYQKLRSQLTERVAKRLGEGKSLEGCGKTTVHRIAQAITNSRQSQVSK